MSMDRRYKIEIDFLTQPTVVQADFNAVTFINNSTAIGDLAYVNNVPLNPGQSLSIEGNANEIDTTVYNIGFRTSTTATLIMIKKKNI